MTPKHLRLSRMRDIGFSAWDPLGLMPEDGTWKDKPFASQYDAFLAQAAGQLRRNTPPAEVVQFLMQVEAEQLGLGFTAAGRERAEQAVAAMLADAELWSPSSEV